MYGSGNHVQDRDTIVAIGLDLACPSRFLERRRSAPGVVIEGEKVAPLVIGAAVHVLRHLETVGVHVGSRVADWNLAVSAASNVLPHVSRYGLDIWSTVGCGIVIDDLVSGEESQGVGVAGKSVDCCKDVL